MASAEIHRLTPAWHRLADVAVPPPSAGIAVGPLLLAGALGYALAAISYAPPGIAARLLGGPGRDPVLLAIVHALIFAGAARPAGWLEDRFGHRAVQIAWLLIGGAGAGLMALAQDGLAAAAGGVLLCAGSAMVYAGMSRVILRAVPPTWRNSAAVALLACGGFAAAGATLPLDAVAATLGGPAVLAILAATSVATAGLVWLLLADRIAPPVKAGRRLNHGSLRNAFDPDSTVRRFPAGMVPTMLPQDCPAGAPAGGPADALADAGDARQA